MPRALHNRLHLALLAACGLAPAAAHAEPAPFMMRATLDGEPIEGQPLAWNSQQMLLLGRDGALHEFHPDDAKNAKKSAPGFVPYSISEVAGRLHFEFGRAFDISTSAHFVVVHPRGLGTPWAPRLESLFGTLANYMTVRGFRPTEPPTPLVAIVFRNADDYHRHAAAGGSPLPAGVVGHYDPISNRVFLFDASDGTGDWGANAATMIHEAVHQAAYNIGVHRRFAEQPRWAVEGLAMVFEARGVWAPGPSRQIADRLNYERLDYFRRTGDQRAADWLVRLVASDRSFEVDALNAYAEAWTLSFYLSETRQQDYSAYLARVASREAFTEYPAMERMTDFTAAFGSDFKLLAAQVQRFVEQLP